MLKALPPEHSEVKSKPVSEQPPIFPLLRVVSWNIYGKGTARLRNRLVPRVIKKIDPDIVLLQETKTDTLIRIIIDESKPKRLYESVCAGERTESQILYDSNKYKIPHNELSFSLDEVFELCREEVERTKQCTHVEHTYHHRRGKQVQVEKRHTRRGEKGGLEATYHRRVSKVCLEHKMTGQMIIFLSFHNLNTSQGGDQRDLAASLFLDIVEAMSKRTGVVVVAGADLNCTMKPHPMIPDYERTERRPRKVDYFIIGSPAAGSVRLSVTACDFVAAEHDQDNPLHGVVRDILRPTETLYPPPHFPAFQPLTLHPLSPLLKPTVTDAGTVPGPHPHASDHSDIRKSLDHDPLVCNNLIEI